MLMICNALPGIRPALKTAAVLITAAIVLSAAACKINPTPPDRYALVYGVSDYDETISYNGYHFSDLNYTDDDAVDIANALSQKGFNTKLRVNNQATKEQFINDLQNYASSLSSSDLLLIYFSGHGTQSYPAGWKIYQNEDQFSDPYDEYLVFFQDEADYTTHTVADTELYSLVRTLPNRKIVIIIDVCHSGGFIGQYSDFDAVPADFDYNSQKNEDILGSAISTFFSPSNSDITPETAIVLTASGERETSAEPGLIGDPLNVENGFFTESILFAVDHGDLNNDGYVDTLELFFEAKAYFEYLSKTYYLNYMPHISGGPVDYILFKSD